MNGYLNNRDKDISLSILEFLLGMRQKPIILMIYALIFLQGANTNGRTMNTIIHVADVRA